MRWWEAFTLRPRLIVAFVAGLAVALALPHGGMPIWTRSLVGWCSGVVIYILLVVVELTRASTDRIRERASQLDDSAPVILIVALAAATASFGAIAALLLAPSGDKTPDIILGALTMVLSWLFTQVIFAVHYTHIYYGDVNGTSRGGLDFGGHDDEPDFWDFLYFTTSIGATAQTSDTMVTSKTMRRVVLAQSVYAFFFNTAVLALAVNIGAGLAGH